MSPALFVVMSLVAVVATQMLGAVVVAALSREPTIEAQPLDPLTALFAAVMTAVLVLYRVAVPVAAAWGIAIAIARRTTRLGVRFAVIAGGTTVVALAMGALLSGFFRDAEGSDLALWVAFSGLTGVTTGALATVPWRGGIASRRREAIRQADGAGLVPLRGAASSDDPRASAQPSPLGFIIVSIGAAASAGWMVVVAFFTTVALPQGYGFQEGWLFGDVVWTALLGVGASAIVALPFVAAATAFGYLSQFCSTLPARVIVVVGGVTLTSAVFGVPLGVAVNAPPALTASVLGLCVAIALALAGGALAPWRFGFAATSRAGVARLPHRRRTRKGRTPKDAAPLSLWGDASDWND